MVGLEQLASQITHDDLKAFSAAFGTSGAAALYHMVGVTPEANTLSTALGSPANDSVDVDTVTLCQQQLATAWKALDSSGGEVPACSHLHRMLVGMYASIVQSVSTRYVCAVCGPDINLPFHCFLFGHHCSRCRFPHVCDDLRALQASTVEDSVQLVAVGNPHLSLTEVKKLAELVNTGDAPAPKHPDVNIVATIGRQILDQAEEAGHRQVAYCSLFSLVFSSLFVLLEIPEYCLSQQIGSCKPSLLLWMIICHIVDHTACASYSCR